MEISRRTLPAFLLAILMHGFLLGVLVIGFEWIPSRSAPSISHSSQPVQAKIVDRDKVLAEIEQRQKSLAFSHHQPPIAPEQQQAEPEPQQSMESRHRQQEIAKQAQQAAKKQQEQARLKQEAER